METANAQSGMNRDTAITQQQLNMVNQVGPTGSLTYNQTGTSRFKDSQGNWVETPTYTATTTLTPAQQAIFDKTQSAQGNLAGIADEQSAFLQDYLAKPFEYNNQDAENWAYDLGAQRLDPRFAQQEEQLRTQLIASGIRPGTAAYDREMGRLGESKNDAYNQLMLTGRQQAYTEALQERNQPLNEISALLSGSQVAMPTFQNTPQTGVGGVDYTGLVENNYQAQLANSQSMMGGLFGLAGTLGMGAMKYSDRRLKTDIRRVGVLDNGLPIYAYRFEGSPVTEIGVMADEVEAFAPHAVTTADNGFKMVDYRLATEAA
jgi:hypothetical protein